jgi:hypothetical protein
MYPWEQHPAPPAPMFTTGRASGCAVNPLPATGRTQGDGEHLFPLPVFLGKMGGPQA